MSDDEPESIPYRCGYAAIIGRPNVGKSTLVNRLVGHKFSITSRKAQTTRHRLLGIKTGSGAQIIYVDTPGLHGRMGRALNRYMNRAATGALVGVDVILFVVESGKWTDDDEHVLSRLADAEAPIIAVLNKIDRISDKQSLLPYIGELAERFHGRPSHALDLVGVTGTNGKTTTAHLVQQLLEELAVGPGLSSSASSWVWPGPASRRSRAIRSAASSARFISCRQRSTTRSCSRLRR